MTIKEIEPNEIKKDELPFPFRMNIVKEDDTVLWEGAGETLEDVIAIGMEMLLDEPKKGTEQTEQFEDLINRLSLENGSDTPDFILAEYLTGCLAVFDRAVNKRTKWYGGR